MQENYQETKVQEVDANGGWLITHHTITFDTRERLDAVEQKIIDKTQDLNKIQEEISELMSVKSAHPELVKPVESATMKI